MKNIFSLVTILAIFSAIVTVKLVDRNLGKDGNYGVVDWDNFGYYLYLPATFIYNDLKLTDDTWVEEAQKKYNLSSFYYQAHWLKRGNRVIQYTTGMALVYSPAFFLGHTIASLSSNYPADGFSLPYQVAILIESIIVLLIGLFFLRKVLLYYFNEKVTTIVLLAIGFGTNFFQLASSNISSPHIFLFSIYAVLLILILRWHSHPTYRGSFFIGTLLSLAILIRPNEILLCFLAIFWLGGKFPTVRLKVAYLLRNKKHLILIGTTLFLFGILQPLYWKYSVGEWLFDSYKNEDFKLLSPYLKEYFFSYKKGWFLYTPLMILGFVGLIFYYRKEKLKSLPVILYIGTYVYILSSWDNWWYADSFSQRSVVQAYPIFIFPLGYFIHYYIKKLKPIHITGSLLLLCAIAFNLFQTYQFRADILHSQRMTKEYYWNIFGEIDVTKVDKSLLEFDRSVNYLPTSIGPKHYLIYQNDFDSASLILDRKGNYLETVDEGKLVLNSKSDRSKRIKFAYSDIADSSYCYIITRVMFKYNGDPKENSFGIEFNVLDSYSNKFYGYKYRGVDEISWFKKGEWLPLDLVVVPAFLRHETDSISVNLKLKGDEPVLFDNLSIEVIDPSVLEIGNKPMVFYRDFRFTKIGQWSYAGMVNDSLGYQEVNVSNKYSSTLKIPTYSLQGGTEVIFTGEVNLNTENKSTYAVASISTDSVPNLFYKSFLIEGTGTWRKFSYSFSLPEEIEKGSDLKVYIWNKSEEKTWIRNMRVTFNKDR